MTRRRLVNGPRLLAAAAVLAAGAAEAADAVRATLKARAALPAVTLVPPPADAPASLNVAGRFAGPGPRRIDLVGSVEGVSSADPQGPRGTGIFLPVAGQPVQGFSGVRTLGGDEFLVITDNGFGSRANSPDALLMFHRVRADWGAGRVRRLETTFLRDPDGLVPFRIALEATRERYLTGADLDTESVQPIGGLVWIGDEFGPYLVAAERATGRVVHFAETEVDGRVVRSPDHYTVGTPAAPGPVRFEVRRSRGFEGMAQSPDGRFLYPLLEAPLFVGDPAAPERVDGKEVLRVLEFDVRARRWTGKGWKYPLEADGNNIGDFNMVDATRALVIERDNNEGDPRLACRGETRPDCFGEPAAFKRVYLVDLGQADAGGMVRKLGYVDLLDIADPDGIAKAGTVDGRFTFPFQTIEGVDVVDGTTIVVENDNNFPYSNGRAPGVADDNEFVLLEVGGLLGRR